MVGHEYAVFDTSVGRCGIVWGYAGVCGVQLPEAREIETRRRLLKRFPTARETRPPAQVVAAIDGLGALLRGEPVDLSRVRLDMHDLSPFHRRVHEETRTIAPGETRTRDEIAARLGASGAANAVALALSRNAFPLLVPCHRVVGTKGDTSGVPANGGGVTNYRLLSIEGAMPVGGRTLFDALLSVAPPQPRQ